MASRFDRHPVLTLTTSVVLLLALLLGIAEIWLRMTAGGTVGYYTAVEREGEIIYPYGVININSHGDPDGEFDLDDPRPRIGYIGDSVIYGVGAGQGYRISDLLRQKYPEYQHMNLAKIGATIRRIKKEYVDARKNGFELDTVVYFLNLNDIGPIAEGSANESDSGWPARRVIGSVDIALRRGSYLYVYIRTALRNVAIHQGIRGDGRLAFELFPEEYDDYIRGLVSEINAFAMAAQKSDQRFCLVLLPYEMQISQQAENVYGSRGIGWGNEFIDRGPQKRIIGYLNPELEFFDAYYAFVDSANVAESRAANSVGRYFVFEKGNSLDWNHLNRDGHRLIAENLGESGFCGLQ